MLKNTFKIIFNYLLLFISFGFFAQDLPPIVSFNSNIYDAGNQNWMITQDKKQFVYFANNEGLIEFNGTQWKVHPSPNETNIRSVKVIDDLIYTGCYMEFGFWKRQSNGSLIYTSLSNKIKNELKEDEHFWNILSIDNWVLFQSFNRIYIFNTITKSFQFSEVKPYIFKSYKVNNSIYFQSIGEGLFEMLDGKCVLISNDERIKNNRIVEIFNHDGGLLLQTEMAGAFKMVNKILTPFYYESESEIKGNTIFCAQKLSNGGFVLGTISNGVFILDDKGKNIYHLTQSTGLSNNTILSIFEDIDKNVWLGLDNGINCINLQTPIKSYKDDQGYLGTVYASIQFQGRIYLGTNQGLLSKLSSSKEKFSFVNGTKGQVWKLFEHDNHLFCGHNFGTFVIDNNSASLIYNKSGTWTFNKVPNNENLIVQGNYNGLSVLEKKAGQWSFKNKIENFDISSRYFEITDNLDIYIGHEYKGIIKVKPDLYFKKIEQFKILNSPKKCKHFSIVKYNGRIYFAGKQGIYILNNKTNQFERNEYLSEILNHGEYISGKFNIDKSNRMWFFTKNYIYYFTSGSFNSELKKHKIPIPFSITNSMLSFENISQINENEYLIGKTDGYFIINTANFNVKISRIYFNTISVNELSKPAMNLFFDKEAVLKYSQNNLIFNYSIPQYNRFIDVKYQYILEGFQDQWSEWSSKSSINFKNLEPGDYVFKVRGKISNSITENIEVFSFTIKKPWYTTNLALLIYLLLLAFIAFYINKAYHNYYLKQKDKLIEENNLLLEIAALENEQELMKVRNEQLSQDVDLKNRELAVSTMSLIKKNELLGIIKEDLKKSSDENSGKKIKSVISTISKNITEDDSWNAFNEAFDNVDKDFLKRIKLKHPSLSPSDLKLCAYLRLNLSSKEIAPMLNISIRSMEIKRHRLRKKLNLEHNEGLVDYILSI